MTYDKINSNFNNNNKINLKSLSLKGLKADKSGKTLFGKIFEKYDLNGDGRISKDEWAKMGEKMLKKIDEHFQNGDKIDTPETLTPVGGGYQRVESDVSVDDITNISDDTESTTENIANKPKHEDIEVGKDNNSDEPVEGSEENTEKLNLSEQPKETEDSQEATEPQTPTTPDDGFARDEEGNIITYPREGESFKQTAKRLGFNPGTPEYEEFANANLESQKRNWFKVGQEVKIPPSVADKVNKDEILTKEESRGEIQKYKEHYAEIQARKEAEAEAARQATANNRPQGTTEAGKKTLTSEGANKSPSAVKTQCENLKKENADYDVTQDENGNYQVTVRSGKETTETRGGEVVFNYDKDGKLVSKFRKYDNGMILETVYEDGKEKVYCRANKAPEAYQKLAAEMRKKDGGNARIEFNKQTNKYEIIQTNLPNKNIKEMRTVVNEKSWQEQTSQKQAAIDGIKDAKNAINVKRTGLNMLSELSHGNIKGAAKAAKSGFYDKPKEAAMRNRDDSAILEDHFESRQITYKDGKVTNDSYVKGNLKKTTTVKKSNTPKPTSATGAAAANAAETTKNNQTLHTATDISFSMPKNAPPKAKEFANALIDNKEKLMKELGVDSDTYNMLAQTAMGIARQETNFGEKSARQIVKDITRTHNDTVAYAQKTLGLDNNSYIKDWSQGMTQIKFTMQCDDPWIKEKMNNLGITNELQLKDTETSAIATMVVLAKLNKEIDAPAYQKGIEAAQGKQVELEGYELNPQTKTAEKTKDGSTKPWTNEITRQDVLCAFWNGNRGAVINGTFRPNVSTYPNNVRRYTNEYKLNENQESRQEAVNKEEESRAFKDMDNSGEMGSVVFMPAMYTDKSKHMNTESEITRLKNKLTEKGIDPNLRNQLVTAVRNGEIGFDFGLSEKELDSMTNADIKLLLKHLDKLKKNASLSTINTGDGISDTEAKTLRENASLIGKAEDNLRQEYLNKHSKRYNASAENPKVLRERSTDSGSNNYINSSGQRLGFRHEAPKPVNVNTTNGRISDQQEILANSGYTIAKQNTENATSGNCLDGVKKAMTNAGIDVSEMTSYGNTPKYIKNWFAAHPEMFTPVEYVSTGNGTAREINYSDIQNLPAGYIVVWEPDQNSEYSNQAGHIVITNGHGQGYADATDNLEWGRYTKNSKASGKGEHGKFVVYKLSDNWDVDPTTQKLVFKG